MERMIWNKIKDRRQIFNQTLIDLEHHAKQRAEINFFSETNHDPNPLGYTATKFKAPLELALQFQRRELKPLRYFLGDILFFCGICHSDIHQAQKPDGAAQISMVPSRWNCRSGRWSGQRKW